MRRCPELRLVLEAEGLKREPRRGWQRIGIQRPESVADHSWRLALMAMLYADLQGLDAGKAARIALLHDLAEARCGDSLPGQFSPQAKHRREARALRALLKPLPTRLRSRYFALWLDYEKGASPEARLVAELDKLEMAAQALAYERRRAAKGGKFDGFWLSADRAIESAFVRKRLDELAQTRPTARRASSSSGRGSRTSRKRYSRSLCTK